MSQVDVPFVDLGPANAAVKDRVLSRLECTIERGDFTNGEAVGEFESRFADYCGVAHCVGVSSGHDALRLALIASGLEEGAGVIVPAHTFAATFEAVIQAGGTPVVVDVGESDYAVAVDQVEAASGSASHVLPVHLYGQMADMSALARAASKRGLHVIEDACQAHGARRHGLGPGQSARAAAFSFYPTKNLGAMGDAGAVVTGDEALAVRVRALRVHGESRKYHHELIGYTARLDTIQAIVLSEKLSLLDEWNEQRRGAALFYRQALDGLAGLRQPPIADGSEPVWHLYVVRTADPVDLAAFLAERRIATARHYPEPPHLAPAYRALGYAPGDFPVAEALAREGLSLPLYPGISEAQLTRVSEALQDYVRARGTQVVPAGLG